MAENSRFAPVARFLGETEGATTVEYALLAGLACVAILAAAEGLWQAISYLYRGIERPLAEATS